MEMSKLHVCSLVADAYHTLTNKIVLEKVNYCHPVRKTQSYLELFEGRNTVQM